MKWRDKTVKSAAELDKELCGLASSERRSISRGQACCKWGLQPGIDRNADPTADAKTRLDEERCLLHRFVRWGGEFLAPLERGHIENVGLGDWTTPATVMQHFGAPTRLLDWTRSPWVAAYFALVDELDKDGAVWWFREEAFHAHAAKQWQRLGWKEPIPDTINRRAFEPGCPDFISQIHLRIPFARAAAQQGLFTIAGQLGREHQEPLAQLLPETEYGRIVIPSGIKRAALEMLRSRNVDSQSLLHVGADRLALRMAWDFQQGRRPKLP